MHITFDPAKDSLNIANHGVSLAVAERLEWDLIWVSEDTREAYSEQRRIGFAHCYRILSLREATNREKRSYINHL